MAEMQPDLGDVMTRYRVEHGVDIYKAKDYLAICSETALEDGSVCRWTGSVQQGNPSGFKSAHEEKRLHMEQTGHDQVRVEPVVPIVK